MKKTRNTRQRGVILDILQDTKDHPTAEMIYRDARRIIPNISLGTVYRNLSFLQDQGLVREIRPCDGGSTRFDGELAAHAHFHCLHCGGLLDIPLPSGFEQPSLSDVEGIARISAIDLHIIGSCANCAGQETASTH
jgi:Fe2+ or Zn2+ uptake regulation protein